MKNYKIGIIGLGYVGLPLAVAFSKKYLTIGYDINVDRINNLLRGFDETMELNSEELNSVIQKNNKTSLINGFIPTNNSDELSSCEVFIVTVPTPIDENKKPLLTPLIKATEIVAKYIKKDNIVVYESTVYPGATEELCVPIIEKISDLKFNHDFFVGYSPERINPGDKEHTITKILKVTSGSTKESAVEIDKIYKSIISAGTYLAPSIKVAEAAKVIENSQRDINIAFVNELAQIFNLLDIDTDEVLKAANTKWNFMPFNPGLVGGHCIGVDPYYLAEKAIQSGYNPEIILSGRKLNDSMGKYVAEEVIKYMNKKNINIEGSNILILGITFKENCPDTRNTKVIDVIEELERRGSNVTVYDPLANINDVMANYNINHTNKKPTSKFDAIVLAVAHKEFLEIDLNLFRNDKSIIYDVKGAVNSYSDYKL